MTIRLHKGNETAAALVYLTPALVLFAVFTFWPFLRAVQFSFFLVDRNTFEPAKWFGLGYYLRAFNLGESDTKVVDVTDVFRIRFDMAQDDTTPDTEPSLGAGRVLCD